MTGADELSSLVAREERFYALQEPKGPLQARWGKTAAAGTASLGFRKFHFPKAKVPSPWGDFRDSSTWHLAEERGFKHRELLAFPPLPAPAGGFSSDRAGWDAIFEKALSSLYRGASKKLVLAREIAAPVSSEERAELLKRLPHRLFYPSMENAYRFLVKARESVFFGATPELLFERQEGELLVPAVAGTVPLEEGVPEHILRDQLLASKKDLAEHQLVVDGIRESLERLGFVEATVPAGPSVLRTSKLLHLFTPITFFDNPSVKGDQLVEALHPTPAIGGLPRDGAKSFLYEYEGFDRGLFSAPLLFRSPGRELCLVAIRSGLLTRDSLRLYAGAGVVRGSSAAGEWHETESKLQVMKSILFGGPHG